MVHLVESVTFTKPSSKEESCQDDLEPNKHKKHNCNHAEANSSVLEDSWVEKTHGVQLWRGQECIHSSTLSLIDSLIKYLLSPY